MSRRRCRGRVALVAALAAALALGGAACTDDPDDAEASVTSLPAPSTTRPRVNVDGVLRVGVLLPGKGEPGAFGTAMSIAVDLAVRTINESGGVLGRPVELVRQSEGSTPAEAGVGVSNLLDASVDVVVGPASSTIALNVLGRITKAGVVACSPAATALALAAFPDDGFFIRTVPSDRLQAVALATLVADEGYTSAAILAPDDDYGEGMSAVLRESLEAEGVIVGAEVLYDPQGTNARVAVDTALRADPSAAIVVGLPDAGGMVLAALHERGQGPGALPTFVNDAMRVPDLPDRVGGGDPSATAGLTGTAPSTNPQGSALFDLDFSAAAPDVAPLFAAYAYDCVVVAALAASEAGTDDPVRFRSELSNVTRGGIACARYDACLRLLDRGRNIDYEGASGPLELSASGDASRGVYDVFAYDENGRDQVVRQLTIGIEP